MANVLNNGDLSLPAVACNFDTTGSRSIKRAATNTIKQSEMKETFNIDQYVDNTVKEQPKTKIENNIFVGFTTTAKKSVINFSNCKLKENSNNCSLVKDIVEPVAKKRKIKILPVVFDADLSVPSTSSCTVNSDTSESKEMDEKSDQVKDKREMGKAYLKDVKKSLTEENYNMFGAMIKEYTKNGDWNELLKKLEYLFPPKGQLHHLFIGFKSFLKKAHTHLFDQYVKNLN